MYTVLFSSGRSADNSPIPIDACSDCRRLLFFPVYFSTATAQKLRPGLRRSRLNQERFVQSGTANKASVSLFYNLH